MSAMLWALPSALAAQQPPVLAEPPAGATIFSIVTGAGKQGTTARWTTPDGTHWARETLLQRGHRTDIEERTVRRADGSMQSLGLRGVSPHGPADETFSSDRRGYTFSSPLDHDGGKAVPGQNYTPTVTLGDYLMGLAETLKAMPGHAAPLVPSGRAILKPLAEADVSNGPEVKHLQAYTIEGISTEPKPIWFEGDRVFGLVGGLSFLPEKWVSVADRLRAAQSAALAKQAPAVVAEIAPRHPGPVAFVHVRVFDADAGTFRDDQTLIARNGLIEQVGPSARIAPPGDALVIQGAGRTLVPGLWDAHQHLSADSSGVLLLSQGITSVRDLGDPPTDLLGRKQRIDNGLLLGPLIVPSLMIDGPGPLAAAPAVVVSDEKAAIAAVNEAKARGYFGVKIYGSLDPALVEPIATEAKRLGLRVQGHVPHGMRPWDAVRDGYDELTHIVFTMMQAMPQDVVDNSNGLQRYYGIARYAPDVDLHAPLMSDFIEDLARRHITIDPTITVYEGMYLTDQGQVFPSYQADLPLLPPQIVREVKEGGLPPTPEVSRDRMKQGYAKLCELVGDLHRNKVAIVAGTDSSGMELVHELEEYVACGFSPAEALQSATITTARAASEDKRRGSLVAGKISDLVLVDGDPAAHVGDLRRVLWVMRGDRLMNAAALRGAAGLSPTMSIARGAAEPASPAVLSK